MKKGQIKNWARKVSFYAAKTIHKELHKLGVKPSECEFFETYYIDANLADCYPERDAPCIVICLAGSVIGGINKAGVSGWIAQNELELDGKCPECGNLNDTIGQCERCCTMIES